MAVNFRFKGTDKLRKQLQRKRINVASAMEEALYAEAQEIMRKSKEKYVPVDLGVLRASGHVDRPVRGFRVLKVKLGFGGAAKAYALAVHEHPSVHSPYSWKHAKKPVKFHPGGHGPKYLTKPIQKAMPGMPKRIEARLRKMKAL